MFKARTEPCLRVTSRCGDIGVSNRAGVHSCNIRQQSWADLESIIMLHACPQPYRHAKLCSMSHRLIKRTR